MEPYFAFIAIYIPLWLLLTALQHLPHGYLTGTGLTCMSPEIASKSTIIAMLTRDSLMYTLGGQKIAGTVETLEIMYVPSFSIPKPYL